jgi:4-hydroxy-2-oxoheptanedioate aldolase
MDFTSRSIKGHLSGDNKIICGWCSLPSPVTAEIVARQNFDAVAIDLQHGLIDYQTALNMLQVVDGKGVPTLCRVPWNEPGIIMKALDSGFSGIICPMINTREDAERFVAACRYAPVGQRSFGPTRAMSVFGPDYPSRANDLITTFAMIETRQALDNLDSILGVREIDAVYIGPADLGLSLGYAPSLLPQDAAVYDAIEEIRSKAKAAGKIAGIHCGSPQMAREMLSGGFDLVTLVTDARIFTSAVAAALADARGMQVAPARPGQY